MVQAGFAGNTVNVKLCNLSIYLAETDQLEDIPVPEPEP
jgi:hypothetical protein